MSKADNPFRYFHSSPDIIPMVVMLYVRHPLSLRNVEDLLFERGFDLCHETVRYGGIASVRCLQPISASE
jgi:putative transposase